MNMWEVIAVVIAAGGLGVSFGAFRLTKRQTTVTESDDARDEAMVLADVRRQARDELRRRVDDLEIEQAEERKSCEEKIDQLRATIDLVREEAAESQRMLVVGVRGVLLKVLAHLETDPPETEEAIEFLRDTLDTEAPPTLGRASRRRRHL